MTDGARRTARLLFPALRWDAGEGFEARRDLIEAGLELGVGGFILFGGEAEAVLELTAELHARSREPLLIGADLERGAGQQFQGATPLPPAAALGAIDELHVSRRAGELTAREARALGVNWVYAPVADLDVEPENPIVGTRAFGAAPERVAEHVVAWIEGCRAGGALSCAKHFPGHGRTVTDSHLDLPHVHAGRAELEGADIVPFRAAADARIDSVMTAHVAYPDLDPSGSPATLSPAIVTELLRRGLGFDGLVVTDALIMAGVLEGVEGEAEAAVLAARAGCDALLYPEDVEGVAAGLERAAGGELPDATVAAALERIDAAATRGSGPAAGDWGSASDRAWALDLAARSLRTERGEPRCTAREVDVITIDDDTGGPAPPPSRSRFPATLTAAGLAVEEVDEARGERPAVVALYADIRAWKGRPGISAEAREKVVRTLDVRPDAPVVLFGHPRLAAELPESTLLAAWGGEPLMQEAAARVLAAGAPSE